MIDTIDALNKDLESKNAFERLQTIISRYKTDRLIMATSFGAEDQVLLDLAIRINSSIRIFTLDTGRQFQETYDVFEETRKKYNVSIEVFSPERSDLEPYVQKNGPNAMYSGIDLRKECCRIRKLVPLRKALSTADAWICGLRQEQSVTRFNCNPAEMDTINGIIKFSPLYDWTIEMVWEYIRKNDVPYNSLHDKNFPSIGCAPCTRAVNDGDDERSGRWWWESAEQKECGLHKRQDA
jgi:phosphoadenosine phosphosulfate reductase